MAQEQEKRTLDALRRAARQLDSQPQLLTAAARLRAMLPGDDRYGDALSLSGRQPHQMVGKSLAAAQRERASLLGEIGLAALQLWEAASESRRRGSAAEVEITLLFTDLVGFSTWALEAGDASAVELLREVADQSEATISEHGGRVVKHLGDGWMAAFTDAPAAVGAALELHRRIEALEADGYRPRLRSGVHSGRPRALGGDFLGVDVNVTARIADAARPGQLLVSEAAAEQLPPGAVSLGRARRLRAPGAPRELRVRTVTEAS